jgi:hypothetical protein
VSLRDRIERGRGVKLERGAEGLLLLAAIGSSDLRPAYVALALLALQVISPLAAPLTVTYALFDRRVAPARLGDIYYDAAGVRGASAISCGVIGCGLLLAEAGWPTVGLVLLAAPCASCLLAATVGFCAGCGYYVVGRDLLVRTKVLRGPPRGACDLELDAPDVGNHARG